MSEARDADGVFYPVLKRLAERFSGERAPDPETVVSFVRTDADRWSTQSDKDDRAVLALSLAVSLDTKAGRT